MRPAGSPHPCAIHGSARAAERFGWRGARPSIPFRSMSTALTGVFADPCPFHSGALGHTAVGERISTLVSPARVTLAPTPFNSAGRAIQSPIRREPSPRRRSASGGKGIMGELPECVDGLPNLCGSEQRVEAAVAASRGRPVVGGRSAVGRRWTSRSSRPTRLPPGGRGRSPQAPAFDEEQGDVVVELPSDVALQLGPHVSSPLPGRRRPARRPPQPSFDWAGACQQPARLSTDDRKR
jgi:hypothetical protein